MKRVTGAARRPAIATALGLLGMLCLPGPADEPARAQSVMSLGESFVDVRLLAGRAEQDGTRTAALVVDMAPEWKTYWRHPGVAGIPPSFDWSRSANLAGVEVLWPRPYVFESFGLQSLGYTGRVVFPLRLTPDDRARALRVRLDLALGVCRDICVLEEAEAGADIAPGAPTEGANTLALAEAQVPRPGAEQGLRAATCRISGAGRTRRFEAALDFGHHLPDPRVIVEGPEATSVTGTRTVSDPETGRIAVSANLLLPREMAWIDRSDIRMTVLAGPFAADIRGCTAPAG